MAFPQDYGIKKISQVLTDNERNNRKVPVDIFYPYVAGINHNTSVTDSPKKFPLICFGHGYLITAKWYSHIVEILVPEGFIMIFPASEAGLFPSHSELGKDMKFALDKVSELSSDQSSPLCNIIDTLKCLMGHSMGGGSSFLAANQTPEAKVIITLAPLDTRPSAVKAASAVKIPTLIFAGSNDCITPPAKYQVPIFNSSASKDKTLILIKGGTHCQMGVSHPKCSLGEKMAGCRGKNISEKDQLGTLARYMIPWLRFFLYRDNEAGIKFNEAIKIDKSVEYLHSEDLPVSYGKVR